MQIKGKVHCFFEQSGTFKNQFIKLGIPAEDYDIQNNFDQTYHLVDLFKEIDLAWEGQPSLFDKIGEDDLVVAFYPCIYFCCLSQMNFSFKAQYLKNKSIREKGEAVIERDNKRSEYYQRLIKLCTLMLQRKLRLVVENPWLKTYLDGNFIQKPSIIDFDRTERGDYMIKPTAYWFFNCSPTELKTYQPIDKNQRKFFAVHTNKNKPKEQCVSSSKVSGVCSEERSMISENYARNWICDFILGIKQNIQNEGELF